MEVLAPVELLLLIVTRGLVIESHVAGDWDVPEHVKMAEDEHEPVNDEFCLLLTCNFRLAIVHAGIAGFVTIHFREEVLGGTALQIEVGCFHGSKFDGH